MLDPRLDPVRRWAVQWLASADPHVAEQILTPDYEIAISGQTLEGRDAYVAATVDQLGRFPGLGLTVHELIVSADQVALRFTQHGASPRRDGRMAAWAGIALFAVQDGRLRRCWAEEDYLARRRQLTAGEVDAIPAPAPSPWTTAACDPAPDAERVVRGWLGEGGGPEGVTLDDGWLGRPVPALLDDPSTEIDALVCSGSRVAFHARQRGRYRGGLDGPDGAAVGRPAALDLAGIVTVEDGTVRGGHVIRDRHGLARSLVSADA